MMTSYKSIRFCLHVIAKPFNLLTLLFGVVSGISCSTSVYAQQLDKAKAFAILSAGDVALYDLGKVNGAYGSTRDTLWFQRGQQVLPADADLNTALSELISLKTTIMNGTATTINASQSDTLRLGNGLYSLSANHYNHLVIMAMPDSGRTTWLRLAPHVEIDTLETYIARTAQLVDFVLLAEKQLKIKQGYISGLVLADTIRLSTTVAGVVTLAGLDLLEAQKLDPLDTLPRGLQIIPTASNQIALQAAITIPPNLTTQLYDSGNFVPNHAFNYHRGLGSTRKELIRADDPEPLLGWRSLSKSVQPDIWYTMPTSAQPNVCDYTCETTAIPNNRFGVTDDGNGGGTIGLFVSKQIREGYYTALDQGSFSGTAGNMGSGRYYAAFRTKGLESYNCTPCQFQGLNGYMNSIANGLGITILEQPPRLSIPIMNDNIGTSGFRNFDITGYYLDDNNISLKPQVFLDRAPAAINNIYDWRLVSGSFSFARNPSTTPYLLVGNYLRNSNYGGSDAGDYFLIDNIELYRVPEPSPLILQNPTTATQYPLPITGSTLPSSASATYNWSVSPANAVLFADSTQLHTNFSVLATTPGSFTVTLTVRTRKYNGEVINNMPQYVIETYSRSATVTVNGTITILPGSFSTPSISPNPFTQQLKVEGAAVVRLTSSLGITISCPITTTETGAVLNTTALPAGIYYLTVVKEGIQTTHKLLKAE